MIKKYYLLLFVLSLFIFIPEDTFALETGSIGQPDFLDVYDEGNDDTGLPSTRITSLTADSLSQTAFWTYNFISSIERSSFRFGYNTVSLNANQVYDLNFIVYTETWTRLAEPYRVVVKDESGHITSCSVSSSSTAYYESGNLDKPTSHYNSVKCSNVVFKGSPFYVYLFDSFETQGKIGISRISYTSSVQSDVKDSIDKNTQKQDEIKDSITNSDVSDSESTADSFFGNFESDDFGLSDVITMPLTFIRGLSSSTCYSLNLPLPFVDTNVTLPCMTSIYQQHFGTFLTLYQTITTGFIAYGICINIFKLVQGFKNPDNDEVEVMEL